MDTIFTVRNEDLARLSPAEAVEFFRDLLWAEARSKGISVSKVHISTSINVPGGGIDALVEEIDGRAGSGSIKVGRTAYQIKTGKNFEPWRDAEIKKELFGDKAPARDNLAASVRDCLDKGGTRWICVSTLSKIPYDFLCKLDLVESQRKQA